MKRLSRLALPLIGAVLLSACSTSPAEHFAMAQQAFAKEDYFTSKTELGQALKDDPRNRDMLWLLARTQLLLGDGEGLQNAVERLRAIGVKDPALLWMEAEALLLRGRGDEAVALLGTANTPDAWRIRAAQRVAEQDAEGALAAFRSGLDAGGNYRLSLDFTRFLIGSGDLAGASTQFDVIRKAQPNALATLMTGGMLSEKYGRRDLAFKYYQSAAARYPFRAEPLVALGTLQDFAGKVPEAAAYAEAAAKIAPGDPAVRELLLTIYSEQGKWQKITDLLQGDEAELDPTTGEGLKYAEALLRIGRTEQARAMFTKALQAQPQNRFVRMMLTETLIATGEADSAYQTMLPAISGPFAGRRELELAAQAAKAAGDPAAAEIGTRLASREFAEQERLSGQAQGAEFRKDPAAALQFYLQLARFGTDPELSRRTVLAASDAGQHDLALATADKALAGDPDNAELMYAAAYARVKAGRDGTRAQALIARALSFDSLNQSYLALQKKAKAAAG